MKPRFKWFVVPIALISAVSASCLLGEDIPDFKKPVAKVEDARLSHPSDIVRFKGRYVVAELYKNRLVFFDDLQLNGLDYFDPRDIGERFNAPHYLAVTHWDTLLVSNGWGGSIVELHDFTGKGWRRFSGVGKEFSAPHGICVDEAGWIYVGDSLNSRLVRFRDMDGRDWQVFADVDKKIAYIRELDCRNGAVWVSNSYEKRPGLNPGRGANVLKITDFDTGRADVVFETPDVNITATLSLDSNRVAVGLWGKRNHLAVAHAGGRSVTMHRRVGLGTPYGAYHDHEAGWVLVAHIGSLAAPNKRDLGGIAVYRR